MRITISKGLAEMIDEFVEFCPICGNPTRADKRTGIKNRKWLPVLNRRRTTSRTVQMECMICGFRFSFNWLTLLNVLIRKAKNQRTMTPQELADKEIAVKVYSEMKEETKKFQKKFTDTMKERKELKSTS